MTYDDLQKLETLQSLRYSLKFMLTPYTLSGTLRGPWELRKADGTLVATYTDIDMAIGMLKLLVEE